MRILLVFILNNVLFIGCSNFQRNTDLPALIAVDHTHSSESKDQDETTFWKNYLDGVNEKTNPKINDLVGTWEVLRDFGDTKLLITLDFHFMPFSDYEKSSKNRIKKLSHGSHPVFDRVYGFITMDILPKRGVDSDCPLPEEHRYLFEGMVLGDKIKLQAVSKEQDMYKNFIYAIITCDINLSKFDPKKNLEVIWNEYAILSNQSGEAPGHAVLKFKKVIKRNESTVNH